MNGDPTDVRTAAPEIRPGEGVGPVRFGLTEPELVRLLGPPDRRYMTETGVDRLQYFGPRVEVAIEPAAGYRFSWVEVHNPDATLFGRRVVGERVGDVIPRLTGAFREEPDHEDCGGFETYFFPLSCVELYVTFGRVGFVNYGVLYGEGDEPRWPAARPPGRPND
jgi:hypothetical protein